jgi:hypothetical protein
MLTIRLRAASILTTRGFLYGDAGAAGEGGGVGSFLVVDAAIVTECIP